MDCAVRRWSIPFGGVFEIVCQKKIGAQMVHPIRSRAGAGQGSLKPAVLRVAKEIVASGDKPPAAAAAAAAAAVEFVLLRSLACNVQSA